MKKKKNKIENSCFSFLIVVDVAQSKQIFESDVCWPQIYSKIATENEISFGDFYHIFYNALKL